MGNKNEEGKPFMDSVFGKVLTGIIIVVILAISYIGWVNSGINDGNFFGMAFQFPLETKDHYCWRKSRIILIADESAYRKCLAE